MHVYTGTVNVNYMYVYYKIYMPVQQFNPNNANLQNCEEGIHSYK